ncbi:MAG: zinc ribbon domain-containing protein [Candidatus Aminicenantes bacterium]|nr:zinc ribbon domain-containing protein [Candidatus Aminicenantes bacterium]
MPIYSFECAHCHKRFEVLVGVVAQEKELQCPACGSSRIKKLLSSFSLGASSSRNNDTNTCSSGSCSTGFCPTC